MRLVHVTGWVALEGRECFKCIGEADIFLKKS